MTKKEKKEPTKKDQVQGLVLLAVIGGGLWLWLGGEDEVEQATVVLAEPFELADQTLEDYANADRATRVDWIASVVPELAEPSDRRDLYENCMGSHAFLKNKALLVADVIGWCSHDEKIGAEGWGAHFNELDAPDLAIQAHIVCKDLVRTQLKAPSTADFPWLPDRQLRQPRLKYVVQSHVDAQNTYGAQVRATWLCQIRYKGDGEPLAPESWDVLAVEISG